MLDADIFEDIGMSTQGTVLSQTECEFYMVTERRSNALREEPLHF